MLHEMKLIHLANPTIIPMSIGLSGNFPHLCTVYWFNSIRQRITLSFNLIISNQSKTSTFLHFFHSFILPSANFHSSSLCVRVCVSMFFHSYSSLNASSKSFPCNRSSPFSSPLCSSSSFS